MTILDLKIPYPEKNQVFLTFEGFVFSDTFIIPVKRSFYTGIYFTDSKDSTSEQSIYKSSYEAVEKNPLNKLFLETIFKKEIKQFVCTVPIPRPEVFPALYSAKFSFNKDKIDCEFFQEL